MSPRRHRRADDPPELDLGRARGGVEHVYDDGGRAWTVRRLAGDAEGKAYRCPGCDHEIPPGMPHVVAWPSDGWGDVADRRHWHTACWRARGTRRPPERRRR